MPCTSHARPDFTFVTYRGLPRLDPDDRLALNALRDRGFATDVAVWNDPAVNWTNSGTCVVRSTWDYHLHYADFLAWVDRVARVTTLLNPPHLIRWNSKKSYLLDLERRGAAIVPTLYRPAGERIDLTRDVSGWHRIVVKPAIGLSTFGVRRFSLPAELGEAQAHADALLARGDALVQPYIESVDGYGERALIFVDGRYSHAVSKTAFQELLPAGEAGEAPVEARADEVAVAKSIVELVDAPPLYARVDLVMGERGKPLLIELELIEPSLFLSMHRPAARTFADALVRAKARGG